MKARPAIGQSSKPRSTASSPSTSGERSSRPIRPPCGSSATRLPELIGNNVKHADARAVSRSARWLPGQLPAARASGRSSASAARWWAAARTAAIFPMDLSVSEINVGGRRMFTGLVHDVTERKQAEEELRAAQRRIGKPRPATDGRIGPQPMPTLVAGEGGGRSRQPGQERLPGQHEPRNPHAHERHHRHDRAGAGNQARRRSSANSSTWWPNRAKPCCG